jgi:hypothetical protein
MSVLASLIISGGAWAGGGNISLTEARLLLADTPPVERVEIYGDCYSAYTMFLGADNLCIDHNAAFYFHHPVTRSEYRSGTWTGRGIPHDAHLRIARHYPAPLRNWYLATIPGSDPNTFYRFTGDQIAKMAGTPLC